MSSVGNVRLAVVFVLSFANVVLLVYSIERQASDSKVDEQQQVEQMYGALFSNCDKSCLSPQRTLSQLKLLEIRLTDLLPADASNAKEEEKRIDHGGLELVSAIINLCDYQLERCLRPKSFEEYSEIIGHHLLPNYRLTGRILARTKVVSSNAYRCLEFCRRQQSTGCRDRIQHLTRHELDQIGHDEREKLIKFFLRFKQDKRVFDQNMKIISAIVDVIEALGVIPNQIAGDVAPAFEEAFEKAFEKTIVKPCASLVGRLVNLRTEYENGYKYYGFMLRDNELWFDISRLCEPILADPSGFMARASLLRQVLRGYSGKSSLKHDISMYLLKTLVVPAILHLIKS